MNPHEPYIHTHHIPDQEPWLHLQKFKYHLQNLPNTQLNWGNFSIIHEDQSNLNGMFNLINIRHIQEHVSAEMENLLNSILLRLIYRNIDWTILVRSFNDPELYSSPLLSPLTHITSEPQSPTTDSLPLPLPATTTTSSAIIQSDDNPVRHRPYHLQNSRVTVINLSTDKNHLRDIIIEENIHWRKKISKNRYCCKLCQEIGHTIYNCWTFKYPFCNDKTPGHWAHNCLQKPSGLNPIHLTTPYDNEVIKCHDISSEL